jgi:anthranilate synthase component 1
MKFTLQTKYKKLLSDTITPVSIYLKLRDVFPNSLLLESSDYHANNNSFSYICCNPIASIKVENEKLTQKYPDGTEQVQQIDHQTKLVEKIQDFTQLFETEELDFKFIHNGLFGFTCYDAVRYFESVTITKRKEGLHLPDMYYAVYQNIIAINHFNNEAYIFNHSYNGSSALEQIVGLIANQQVNSFHFRLKNESFSNLTDEQYLQNVAKAMEHCQRGDVFQLVLSRRFSQAFQGDEFNVYRALRSVNPSPYLFYFDYGDFIIFGSSPEAQLVIQDQTAEIHPIAGTFKRTGNDEQDAEAAKALAADPKENAEHVMLVDLARNDLSRNATNVQVETYREIQYFSHVIHLVSKVVGQKKPNVASMQLVADTFPAGTLSGAPKHKALQLIEKYENVNRDAYGGAIGFMDFKGNFNQAIIIRSFVSKNKHLHYQAGAGIVSSSKPQDELQEVYNKLGALTKALKLAEDVY